MIIQNAFKLILATAFIATLGSCENGAEYSVSFNNQSDYDVDIIMNKSNTFNRMFPVERDTNFLKSKGCMLFSTNRIQPDFGEQSMDVFDTILIKDNNELKVTKTITERYNWNLKVGYIGPFKNITVYDYTFTLSNSDITKK